MLFGKVYLIWEGYIGDVIVVYDNLISFYFDDFRGYLVKVKFLFLCVI